MSSRPIPVEVDPTYSVRNLSLGLRPFVACGSSEPGIFWNASARSRDHNHAVEE